MLLRRVGVLDEPPGCVPLGARAVWGNIAGHVALRQQHGGHELAGELRKPEQGSAAFEEKHLIRLDRGAGPHKMSAASATVTPSRR